MFAEVLSAIGNGAKAVAGKAIDAVGGTGNAVQLVGNMITKGNESNARLVQPAQVATNNPVASDGRLKNALRVATSFIPGSAGISFGARLGAGLASTALNTIKKNWNDSIDRARQQVKEEEEYENSMPEKVELRDIHSDERLKRILRTEDPVDCFAKIDSYIYKYTPEARAMYGDEEQGGTVNGEENFGVMAQDLQKNPLTQAAVKEDENGYLMLDGGRLSSINTAMIAELCKKVKELEAAVYGGRR